MKQLWPGVALCVAVAAAATAAGASTVPPEPSAYITYRLDVDRPPRVCSGRTLKLAAAVSRVVQPLAGSSKALNPGLLAEQDGVPITATVADPEVLSPAKAVEITGWPTFSGPPSKATFRFKANKAGDTSITFKANISGMKDFLWPGILNDAETKRSVRVRDCWFKVSVVSEWDVPGEANIGVSAGLFEAELRPTPAGTYEATRQVMWGAVVSTVGDCSSTLVVTSSTATLRGTIDDDGQLMLTVSYNSAPASIVGTCGSYSLTATPDSVIIEGSANRTLQGTEPQALNAGGQFNPGEADYVVIPMEDE